MRRKPTLAEEISLYTERGFAVPTLLVKRLQESRTARAAAGSHEEADHSYIRLTAAAAERFVILSVDELEAVAARAAQLALSARVASDVLLSPEEAAAQLGITPNALLKRVQRGLIVPDQRGGRDGIKRNGFAQSTLDAYKRKHST